MKYEVYFTRMANSDVDEILEFIAKDNPQNALQFIDQLEERISNTLSTSPHAGSKCGDSRYFAFDNYVVVYDIDEAKMSVYVLMVSEGHRQWQSIFADRYRV